MTLSRMPILIMAAGLPAAASAQGRSAREVMSTQQQAVRDLVRDRCPPAPSGEILVCAPDEREQRRHRLPLPVASAPDVRNQAGGEQLSSMRAGDDPCAPIGPMPRCNGGLPILPAVFKIIQGIRHRVTAD